MTPNVELAFEALVSAIGDPRVALREFDHHLLMTSHVTRGLMASPVADVMDGQSAKMTESDRLPWHSHGC